MKALLALYLTLGVFASKGFIDAAREDPKRSAPWAVIVAMSLVVGIFWPIVLGIGVWDLCRERSKGRRRS